MFTSTKILSQFGLLNGSSRRGEVKELINNELGVSSSYLILLVGSGVVATLGLLINNSVVVMGSMLMAPLYWPVIGVALGIASGQEKMLKKSLLLMMMSTLLVLIFSVATATLSPLNQVTREIQIRATPTLLDLLIALTTSIIGVLAIYDSRVSSSIVGVALSLSLLPPLSNAGIGLAYKNVDIFWGSFQLYFANVIAIVFVGTCIFYFLKFRPKNNEDKKRFGIGFSSSLVLLMILAVSFFFYLKQRVTSTNLINALSQKLEIGLNGINPGIVVEKIDVSLSGIGETKNALVISTIYLPENVHLSLPEQNRLASELGKLVAGEVKLQLNIVNSLVSSFRDEKKQIQTIKLQLQGIVENYLNLHYKDWKILSLEVDNGLVVEKDDDEMRVNLVVMLPAVSVYDQEVAKRLETQLWEVSEKIVLDMKMVRFE